MDKAGNDISVKPGHAKEAILQHYCKSCDMIVSGVAMFYTGGTPLWCPAVIPADSPYNRHLHQLRVL